MLISALVARLLGVLLGVIVCSWLFPPTHE
jgi:hypothetical protein